MLATCSVWTPSINTRCQQGLYDDIECWPTTYCTLITDHYFYCNSWLGSPIRGTNESNKILNQTRYYVKRFIELRVGSYILHPLLSSLFKLLNNGSKCTEFVYPKLIAFIIESKGCSITELVLSWLDRLGFWAFVV